ncbi:hypothetical protein HYQ46_001527 [Verticillium longisporum]|nr:hypothetical protein HYQ46_001527 [Verticillium longisporum]
MTPRLSSCSIRARYLAAVSSSRRSGKATGSRAICKELFLEVLEPGVAGVRLPGRPLASSEFCRNLFRPKRSPRLFRPVDDDVRVVPGFRKSSIESRPRELIVDDLPRSCSRARVGEERPECMEPGRKRAVAGDTAAFVATSAADHDTTESAFAL